MDETEAAEKFPGFWSEYARGDGDVRFPGGEPGGDVIKRQDGFLKDMEKETGNVLVVSHDGFIRQLVSNILGAPVWRRDRLKTSYGSLTVIEYTRYGWVISGFNIPL